jgi:hypothetical protein
MKRLPILLTVPLALAVGCSTGPSTGTGSGAAPVTSGLPSAEPVPDAAAPTASTGTASQKAVAAEKNPPGDIPDNVAYVAYSNPTGRYSFTHPEGWAETTRRSAVVFTDKLNGVQGEVGALMKAPTVDSAKQQDIPALMRSQAAFDLRALTAVSLAGGTGVRIVYRRNSAPDPVTGRQYRDEVERYELVSHGREVIVELYGPVGSDNVDAYRMMITSLRIA